VKIAFKDEVIAYCSNIFGFLIQVPTLAREYTQEQLEATASLIPAHVKGS
jgi:hypothetical protein